MTATLFQGGSVVDVERGRTQRADVRVEGGLVQSVGPALPAGADLVVDARERVLMPGLIDLHTHPGMMEGLKNDGQNMDESRVRRDLRIWARYGVTTVQGMGTDRSFVFDVARDRRPDEARLFSVGNGFGSADVPPFKMDPPGPLRETDLARVRSAIEGLAARGASGVKIWYDDWYAQFPKMAPEVAHAVIEASAANGLRSYAHVWKVDDAKALIDAGLRTLAHMPRDRVADDGLWQAMQQRDVPVLPTLGVPETNVIWLDRPAFLEDPFFTAHLPPGSREMLVSDAFLGSIRAKKEFPFLRSDLEHAMQNARAAHEVGAPIAFGTDSGVSQRVVGFYEHRELELLVGAGIPPTKALRAATVDAARVLGRDDLGRISVGARADIVLLRGDPLSDVRNAREIESVWIDGVKACGAFSP